MNFKRITSNKLIFNDYLIFGYFYLKVKHQLT